MACQMVEWSVRAACVASFFRRRTHNPVSLCSFRVVDEYVLSPYFYAFHAVVLREIIYYRYENSS